MASVLALVSKKIFETQARAGKSTLGPGAVWGTARYETKQAAFNTLKDGGSLFLVTVRPPNERLWLVAVLRTPAFDGKGWHATSNSTPITDITRLRAKLTFASGATLTAERGKLGMSLQTPRALSDAAVELLEAAGAGKASRATPIPLNRHEPDGPLPCLCARCFDAARTSVEHAGLVLTRESVNTAGRILHYWLPSELAANASAVQKAVEVRLAQRYRKAAR